MGAREALDNFRQSPTVLGQLHQTSARNLPKGFRKRSRNHELPGRNALGDSLGEHLYQGRAERPNIGGSLCALRGQFWGGKYRRITRQPSLAKTANLIAR